MDENEAQERRARHRHSCDRGRRGSRRGTQGGLAHVLRAWETTFVWIDGMQEIYEYTTSLCDEIAESQMYPTFAPADFLCG